MRSALAAQAILSAVVVLSSSVFTQGTAGQTPTGSLQPCHSDTVDYAFDRTQSIAGTLVRVVLDSSPAGGQVEVSADGGVRQLWLVEWGPRLRLDRQGVTGYPLLRSGDQVSLTGYASRNSDEHRLLMLTISRTDGWKWSYTWPLCGLGVLVPKAGR